MDTELYQLVLSSPQPALGVSGGTIVAVNDSAAALLGDVLNRTVGQVFGEELANFLQSAIRDSRRVDSCPVNLPGGSMSAYIFSSGTDAAILLRKSDENGEETLPGFMLNLDVQLRSRISTLLPALEIIWAGLDGGDIERARRYLYEARRSALSLLRLANNVRDMARCMWKSEFADTADADLVALCRNVVDLTAQLSAYKNVTISLSCPDKELIAGVDSEKIERMLYNLLSNAVMHSREGGRVDLSLFRKNGHVLMRVRDYGEGIDATRLAQVHDSFRTHSEHTGSLGLGLPLTYELARLHGGSLFIESRKGEGTVVTVTLPDQPGNSKDDFEDFSVDYTGHHPHHLVELADFPYPSPAYAPGGTSHSTEAKV